MSPKKTASKPTSTTATPSPADGAPAPADFILTGELAERFSALAKQRGVSVESLTQQAVERLLGQMESASSGSVPAVDLSLNPEQRAALGTFKINGDDMMHRHVQKAAGEVRKWADQMLELPPTPNLDRLHDGDLPDYEAALARDGIFLPVPGLLGEVAIPQSKALLALAELVVNFQSEIMVQIAENYPELRRQSAEAVLLAEFLFLKLNGYKPSNATRGGMESEAQLFWRWSQTATAFEEFEKLRDEAARYATARAARDNARKVASTVAA